MNKYFLIAQTYSQGPYGNCRYSQNTNDCVPVGGSTGGLSDTGFLVAVIVTAAALIMLVAILVRFWRRASRVRQLQVELIEAEENDDRPRSTGR